MSQFYSGQDGVLKVAGETAGKVRSWSFTANQAVLETTSLGDSNRTLEAGVRKLKEKIFEIIREINLRYLMSNNIEFHLNISSFKRSRHKSKLKKRL